MNARPRPTVSSIPIAALALGALSACHGSAEFVVSAPPDPVYVESEPNDDAFTADYFGFLEPGDGLCIEGQVRDDAYDPQDGFAFQASGPIAVEFALDAGCACADLDVWIYDPLLDQFVGAFDSPQGSEHGTFTVYGQSFHIVVVSAGGDASYRLSVSASAFYGAVAEAPAVGAEGQATVPARAPSAVLEGYRRRAELAGAPRVVEIFAIDPRRGVVGRTWIPAAD